MKNLWYLTPMCLEKFMVPDPNVVLFNIDMEDQLPEKDEDIYRVEVSQKNGQWAYSSPIFVRNV